MKFTVCWCPALVAIWNAFKSSNVANTARLLGDPGLVLAHFPGYAAGSSVLTKQSLADTWRLLQDPG